MHFLGIGWFIGITSIQSPISYIYTSHTTIVSTNIQRSLLEYHQLQQHNHKPSHKYYTHILQPTHIIIPHIYLNYHVKTTHIHNENFESIIIYIYIYTWILSLWKRICGLYGWKEPIVKHLHTLDFVAEEIDGSNSRSEALNWFSPYWNPNCNSSSSIYIYIYICIYFERET